MIDYDPPAPEAPHNFRRVAILFAGGPAPAANAVISTAAVSFLRNDIEVRRHPARLLAPGRVSRPTVRWIEGRDYIDARPHACSAARATRRAS